MTAYAAFACVFLLLLAATGREDSAQAAALGWAATCGLFAAIYVARCRRSARPVPAHRRVLDHVVLAQWTIAPAIVVFLVSLFDIAFLSHTGRFLDAAGIATVVGGLGVYVSAAVDWYLILPSVSGIVRPAPCQSPGRERWAAVSKLWFFHRGAATILVTLCILGMFGYMAVSTEEVGHDSERLAWLGAIAIAGAVFYRFQNGALTALWWGLRAPRHVGDIVTLEDGRLAYIVDLAVQGANYMRLDHDRSYPGAKFPYKKDDDIPLELVPRLKPHNPGSSGSLSGPCRDSSANCSSDAEWCSGINWYCRCNPDAYGAISSAAAPVGAPVSEFPRLWMIALSVAVGLSLGVVNSIVAGIPWWVPVAATIAVALIALAPALVSAAIRLSSEGGLSPRQTRVAWLVGITAGVTSIANAVAGWLT